MRKKTIMLASVLTLGSVFAQKDINLTINHVFEGAPFAYNTTYTGTDGKAVSFSRVQYYLSGFELTHDGGQSTAPSDAYVLASGNVSSYSLGTVDINTLEAITFDFGLSYDINHMGTSNWASNHPLSSQSPTMDWGWPAGYFFFIIDGMVDDNNDGVPNKLFQMHGIGDVILRDVNPLTEMNLSGASIDIVMDANIADWIKNVNLVTTGFDHSGSTGNQFIATNTNTETVFTLGSEVSVEEIMAQKANIHADYSLPYAPTLVYKLPTTKNVKIQIYDANGRVVLESNDQAKEGNFFINRELMTGTYYAVFSNDDVFEKFNFIVRK